MIGQNTAVDNVRANERIKTGATTDLWLRPFYVLCCIIFRMMLLNYGFTTIVKILPFT